MADPAEPPMGFKFNTHDTWQVAFHHGHSAFRLLRIAQDIESEYCAIHAKLPNLPFGQADHLQAIGRTHFLTQDMFRVSTASIMMFQAMMEAIVNHALSASAPLSQAANAAVASKHKKKTPRPSFCAKWERSLRYFGKPTTSFAAYNDNIYKKYRNKLVHPEAVKANTFNDLTVAELLAGYEQGWEAYRLLFEGLGRAHDAGSWQNMCQTYGLALDA